MKDAQHRDVSSQTDIGAVPLKHISVYEIQPEIARIIQEDGSYWQFAGHTNNKVMVLFQRFFSDQPQSHLIIQGTLDDRVTLAILLMTKYAVRALPDERVHPTLLDLASQQVWTEVKPCSVVSYGHKRKRTSQGNDN